MGRLLPFLCLQEWRIIYITGKNRRQRMLSFIFICLVLLLEFWAILLLLLLIFIPLYLLLSFTHAWMGVAFVLKRSVNILPRTSSDSSVILPVNISVKNIPGLGSNCWQRLCRLQYGGKGHVYIYSSCFRCCICKMCC